MYGMSATDRARLTAEANCRWCREQLPEIRRGRILPRSEVNFNSRAVSRKSNRSTRSMQNLQALRRRGRRLSTADPLAPLNPFLEPGPFLALPDRII